MNTSRGYGYFIIFALFSLFFTILQSSAHASSSFSKAKFHGKPKDCGPNAFFDPRNGGECWSCPEGYKRTAYAVTDSRACVKPAYTKHKKAKKKRKNSRVGQGCDKGQFWDVKGGNGLLGACYSCGGWNRTAYPVDSKKACSTRVHEKLTKATFKNKFLCPSGQFFDLKDGGGCWSCPPSHKYRTINAIDSSKACSDSIGNIFSVDTSGMCLKIVGAMREGDKAMSRLARELDAVISPVMNPLEKVAEDLSKKIKQPKELEEITQKMERSLEPYTPMIEAIKSLKKPLSNTSKLKSILLNPDLICKSSGAKINKAFQNAGFKIEAPTSSYLPGLFVTNAYADDFYKPFYSVSASIGFSLSDPPVGAVATLSYVHNNLFIFGNHNEGGLYFSLEYQASVRPSADISWTAQVFPYHYLGYFEGQTASLNFASGSKIFTPDTPFYVPSSITFSFDPFFKYNVPGFGISGGKSIGPEGANATLSFGNSWKIAEYSF